MTATASAVAGSYYFTVTFGSATSSVATLTIAAAGTPTVNLSAQSGTISSGTAGSATFAATTANIATGTPGGITWYTSSAGTVTTTISPGITWAVTTVASNASTVTMTATASAVAGSYYFTVTFGSATSSVATLAITGWQLVGSADFSTGEAQFISLAINSSAPRTSPIRTVETAARPR